MKLGIMQPYFLPYIGYWQLMNAVDKYVIYDDVNFIKGGWINRNRILVNGKVEYFNLPMIGASPNKLINEVAVNNDPRLAEKRLKTMEMAYGKAPYYQDVADLYREVLTYEADNIAEFIAHSFRCIGDYLGINTEFIISSDIDKDNSLHGQDKVISICKILGATDYYNATGGQQLYDYAAFREHDIQLHFLQTDHIEYPQFGGDFEPNLSIMDVMMFNSVEEIHKMLGAYTLISDSLSEF